MPTAIISGDKEICAGEESIFTASGGNAYLWSTNETTSAIKLATAKTVTVTVTDVNGCKNNVSETLTVNVKPTANIDGATEICTGSATTYTATGGSAYEWNNGVKTASVTVNAAGSYTVTVTGNGGCTDVATKTLSINNNPTATITGDQDVCQGESSTFTAIGGTKYLWSGGLGTTASITVSTAGTYSVTVTDASG
ncbi:MAG: hypothetical protein IPO92_11465 [Saprospiraceae bacterium]|nr:hypothetical protein [Saprospiraceae bacterium]